MLTPNFSPQLAEDVIKLQKLNKGAGAAVTWPKYASSKLDGIRAETLNNDTLARSLKPIVNTYVRSKFREFQGLDGEFILGDPTAEGVYGRTQSALNSVEGEPNVTFFVFDDLTDLSLPFHERLLRLTDRAKDFPPYIQLLEQCIVADQAGLDALYQLRCAEGYEGLILRNPDSLYKFGRCTAKSQDMLKIKPFQDSECEILSVYEAMKNNNIAFKNELGRTERSTHKENLEGKGMIGGFHVRDLTTGLTFDCGAGTLTHADRIKGWVLRDTLVGKVFTYRFMPYGIKESTGIPRFPRFKGWREVWDMSPPAAT